MFIDVLIRSTKLRDDVVNVATNVAFFIVDNFFFDFVDHNRNLNFNNPWNRNVKILVEILSLTEFFRVGQFRLRNQTLEIANFADDNIFFVILVNIRGSRRGRRIVQTFLNTQIANIPSEPTIVPLKVVLLKFGLE